MFKKRAANPKKSRNVRKSEDEDDEDDVTERIEESKKKRKIIASVQTKRGLDTSELVQTKRTVITSETTDDNAPGESSNYGILDRKHRKAMEDYVNSKLDPSQSEANSGSKEKYPPKQSKPLTEDALYSEIAAVARQLSGKGPQTGADADKEDSGSGGAVLVAGTGIAEVILPAKERLKLEKATEEAKAARFTRKRAERKDPAPAVPTAIPNRFSVPANIRPPSGMEEHFQGSTTTTGTPQEEVSAPAPAVDDGRVGFEALKQQHHGISTKRKPQNRSNDQRVFQNFVTRQREMKK